MLGLGERRAPGEWRPPVVKTVAMQGDGIDELVEAIDKHQAWLAETGELRERRVLRAAREVEAIALAALRARMGQAGLAEGGLDALAAEVVDGALDPYAAADRLVDGVREG